MPGIRGYSDCATFGSALRVIFSHLGIELSRWSHVSKVFVSLAAAQHLFVVLAVVLNGDYLLVDFHCRGCSHELGPDVLLTSMQAHSVPRSLA